jgi:hypothetical protein
VETAGINWAASILCTFLFLGQFVCQWSAGMGRLMQIKMSLATNCSSRSGGFTGAKLPQQQRACFMLAIDRFV